MRKRRKQSIIATAIALVGIILILSVAWIMSKEHRFKNYYNKPGGFSINYPASWSFQENKGGASVIFFSPQENDLDFFKESVNVVVQDISANPMDLKAYTELAIKQMKLVFEDNFIILDSGMISIGGQPGFKMTFLGKGSDTELKYMSAWTLDGLTAYQITYTAVSSQYDRYIGKMKRMVSSFRIE